METQNDNAKHEAEITALKASVESLKVKVESLAELRQASQERFSQLNELAGELRGMIMDLSKSVQRIEVSATKAVDKVEAVQPEKLLIEVRRVDAKVEALKANIESNEAMMDKLFEQLKQLRASMAVFRGLEQVIKLSEEVKGELAGIRKVEANVQRHADKVGSIFMEFQKEFDEFNQLTGLYKGLEAETRKLLARVDSIEVKLSEKAMKKDLENLTGSVKKHEEHVSNILTLITKKAKELEDKVNEELRGFKQGLSADFEARGRRINLLINKLNTLVENSPKIGEILRLSTDELKPETPAQPEVESKGTESEEQ